MLGVLVTIVLVAAAAFAVTQVGGVITLLFSAAVLFLAYKRLSLIAFAATFTVLLAAYTALGHPAGIWKGILWVMLALLWLFTIRPLRKSLITRPFMKVYLRMLPRMSQTEREALEAGTVWWDGELFTGAPKWDKLCATKPPQLSAEEQAFLDGPCEELCRMLDDWDITHVRGDLPPAVWDFLKKKGFFAMIIPKKYGGLEFSAYAHSCVLVKLASRSTTASSTVAVPNSLGPAELLNHYGTEEQKDYFLPRLARGEEVPCFALTGPRVGSDAAALPDTGVVCRGMWQGKEIIGLKLNFSKRYITLAPIATVVGLAFRMLDPERLLGGETDLGITCALVPRDTPGITIGRRHFPLNIPFQNGPLQGHDVFVPLDALIGGVKMAGQGWRMLVEQLSVGRCISLPSNATGGAKAGVFATGAYARIRRQFNLPVGKFEGVEAVIARMVGYTYIMDAGRSVTAGAIDGGEKPSVPAAMLKYHVTEMGRQVADDAMDVQGGKGIMLGPGNYLARGYQSVPIAITVEGANILTRNLMIFGQGAIRCHPFVMREMTAARNPDRRKGVDEFDRALFGHMGFAISNAVRSLVMALTLARFTKKPVEGPTARYYQHIVRFSASFAFAVDVAMLTLGGYLKKKESLSARLGDVLSCMYLASMVLKHHENQGRPEADLPIVEWACRDLLYTAQEQLHGFLRNFPNPFLAGLMRLLIFPRGLTYFAPGDRLGRKLAELVTMPTDTRDRLCVHVYRTLEPGNALGLLQEALVLSQTAEPLEKRLRVEGVKTGRITALDLPGQIQQGLALGILSETEAAMLRDFDRKVMHLINVDDFAPHELGVQAQPDAAARAADTADRRLA
ncbi:MAG TPA: acyl-CoA dehydrogenase [Steroidobacteraceae bacterium]|nr:acyl-CoA dehydrogenase [Steroidobacteraceae bacterium]HQX46305.1 acyl-CoA dehydrogenase [Steroidobacteraceae bacterium]HQX78688.1 acyl-CoA dehydrogenase [Steroidobacteraceae bacterium]HQZ79243.1 acyl-CoA dehydrogenase [Steroidobacteraceae bacterium]